MSINKNIIIQAVFVILIIVSACDKQQTEPQTPTNLTPKNLDFITLNDTLLFEFFYINDTISEYNKYGSNAFIVKFKNRKVHEINYTEGHSLKYEYSTSGAIVRVYHSDYPDHKMYYHLMDDNGKVIESKFYTGDQTIETRKYVYIRNNLKKINIEYYNLNDDSYERTIYFSYDNAHNPWYDVHTIGDLNTYSENNYTELNSFPYADHTYDEQGYLIETDYYNEGVYKYYYR